MKFEKFLKSVGTHGEIIVRSESEKWLVCDGVGMVIPRGVDNLLGRIGESRYANIVHALAVTEYDDPLYLKRAVLLHGDDKAADIYRIFANGEDEEIAITNADYGLIEKKDKLGYMSILIDTDENGEPLDNDKIKVVKYILIYDRDDNVKGFITGSQII